jgi:cbb3-type cytochrome oxidase subunit 3
MKIIKLLGHQRRLMKDITRGIIIITLFLFMPLVASADEIILPVKDDKVYPASETQLDSEFYLTGQGRLYDLKVKLNPKVVESKVYWQGKENIDWQKEIDNWHLGFLPVDEIVSPLIIDKDNFYPREKDCQGECFWGKNNMRLKIFNPLDAKALSYLEFSANSHKKGRTLEIWINNKLIEKIKIPKKNGFENFRTGDILLERGMNEIKFYCPEGTDKLEAKKWDREKQKKEVSIKFKGFRFGNLAAIQNAELKEVANNIKCVPQDGFLDIIFSTAEPIIFSRDIDVDLREFPLLNLTGEFERAVDTKLFAFLGVDYTGDEFIDDYLNLEEFGEYNLFELAKNKWQDCKNKFKLKKVILLHLPENKKTKENQIDVLRLKDITLYNDNSLIVVRKEFNKDSLRFEDINTRSGVMEENGKINIMSYFDALPYGPSEEDELIEEKFRQNREGEPEEVRVFIPLEGIDWENYPYFSFTYNLDEPQIQDVEVALSIGKEGEEKLFDLTKFQYQKSTEEMEVNLQDIAPNAADIKGLIIRLKRRDNADCSLSEKKGWYQFQLSNLKLYEKFPYPIRSKQHKERFLNLAQVMNLKLLKVDGKTLGLNDFQGWGDYEIFEGKIFSKRIGLAKGKHKYEKSENPTFDVEWAIFEPITTRQLLATGQEPEITFENINPTKYLVRVSQAKGPFWLVFLESFHKQWRLYPLPVTRYLLSEFEDIIADYPEVKTKEVKHVMKFAPQDIKFLFENSMEAPHYLVNGYANGWYIEPKRLGLGEDFILVIYFLPQSFFYLGIVISGLTFLGCIGYLLWRKKKEENAKKAHLMKQEESTVQNWKGNEK